MNDTRILPKGPPVRPKKGYYGYVIILIAALSCFFSAPGQTYFISAFTNIYVDQLGWERAAISSLYSAATLLSGLLIVNVGRIADRLGNKITFLAVGLLFGGVCFWNSFSGSLPSLFIGFFFCRFLGQGSLTFLPALVLPDWFVKKRGMAFSLMSIGGVAASTGVPILNAGLLGVWDWRNVWRLWGVLLWVVFLPAVYFFLFDKPRKLGLLPDNEQADGRSASEAALVEKSFTPAEALRTFAFWGMTFCQMVIPLVGTGITFHIVSIFQSKGMTAPDAALILSVFSLVSFPVTLIAGRFMDNAKQHHVAALIALLELAALVSLLLAGSMPPALLFVVLHGSAQGIQSVNNGIVWSNYFGTRHLGTIRGFSMMGTVISSAIGPLPFGILFAIHGNYRLALLLMMILPIAAFFVALLAKKPAPHARTINKGELLSHDTINRNR